MTKYCHVDDDSTAMLKYCKSMHEMQSTLTDMLKYCKLMSEIHSTLKLMMISNYYDMMNGSTS